MAKKVSKTSSKKKTTKKSAASSKKKTAKKSARAATTKKKTTKKPASKKTTSTGKTSKKKVTKKSTTKKTSTKKKVTKKSTKKKTASTSKSSRAVTKKTKATTPKKTSTSKQASGGKTSKKSGTTKKSTKGGDKASDPGTTPRFRGAFATSHDEGLAAAQRLASAAGLSGLSRASQEREKQKKYRRVTKSPFNADQLAEFREMLREKRRQLVGDVSSMETEALSRSEFSSHTPNHMADQGSDTYDQSLNLDLAASQRTLLGDIDDALMRIENGTYGICELLGKPIKSERLKNTPWARFSIEAARMIEDDPSILRRAASDDD
ncbi:MAG: hypothetical protein Tsb0013_00170 [Phycisphaerales bacterium]